jgi:hypothetical protein
MPSAWHVCRRASRSPFGRPVRATHDRSRAAPHATSSRTWGSAASPGRHVEELLELDGRCSRARDEHSPRPVAVARRDGAQLRLDDAADADPVSRSERGLAEVQEPSAARTPPDGLEHRCARRVPSPPRASAQWPRWARDNFRVTIRFRCVVISRRRNIGVVVGAATGGLPFARTQSTVSPVLVIRAAQLEALRRGLVAAYDRRVTDWLATHRPEAIRDLREGELQSYIDRGRQKAIGYALTDEDSIRRFIACLLRAGRDADRQPWAAAILCAGDVPARQRLDRLEQQIDARAGRPT